MVKMDVYSGMVNWIMLIAPDFSMLFKTADEARSYARAHGYWFNNITEVNR